MASSTQFAPRILKYRYAKPGDTRQILSLEAMQDGSWIPLSEREYLAALQKDRPFSICLVYESGDKTIDGYLLYQWQENPEVEEGVGGQTMLVTRLVIHPDERYSMVERGFFHEIWKRAVHGRAKAVYHCRERDLGQQLILKDTGFRATKVLPGYFLDTGEDAYQFEISYRSEKNHDL